MGIFHRHFLHRITESILASSFRPVVLNWGDFAPPKGHVETFLVVMVGEGGRTAGSQYKEARDSAKRPTMHRTVSHSKEL